jgi:uncharacterized membrane protein
MFFGEIALIFAAFFTGAAFYISFSEQPSRIKLEANQLLVVWILSYKRGSMMQASLAAFSGISGLYAFYLSHDWRWLVGTLFILTNWPYTLTIIMPINKKLMTTPINQAGPETIKYIIKWGTLHKIRTILGTCATFLFLWALH